MSKETKISLDDYLLKNEPVFYQHKENAGKMFDSLGKLAGHYTNLINTNSINKTQDYKEQIKAMEKFVDMYSHFGGMEEHIEIFKVRANHASKVEKYELDKLTSNIKNGIIMTAKESIICFGQEDAKMDLIYLRDSLKSFSGDDMPFILKDFDDEINKSIDWNIGIEYDNFFSQISNTENHDSNLQSDARKIKHLEINDLLEYEPIKELMYDVLRVTNRIIDQIDLSKENIEINLELLERDIWLDLIHETGVIGNIAECLNEYIPEIDHSQIDLNSLILTIRTQEIGQDTHEIKME